jgi:S-adenosylmethionine:tRNA ribosyltransferase-isomerase
VRLLVSDVVRQTVAHARFSDLPHFLRAGDTLVVNTSGTLKAALGARDRSGKAFDLHLSTQVPGGFWAVEVRVPDGAASAPHRAPLAGERLALPDGGEAVILAPYPVGNDPSRIARLWLAALHTSVPLPEYLDRYGRPIRYRYVTQPWDAAMYQTIFATEAGSAEMPSAGRPFTPEVVTRLGAGGVQIVPVLLHTGVSSLEDHEPPYEEFFRVTEDAAARITAARQAGRRIVAVGTTVVRALETVTDSRGITSPGDGWTSVVISNARSVRSIDGIITGLHEPLATHLALIEQVIAAARRGARQPGRGADSSDIDLLGAAYGEALQRGYLWHEFGDSHLVIGGTEITSPFRGPLQPSR